MDDLTEDLRTTVESKAAGAGRLRGPALGAAVDGDPARLVAAEAARASD